MKHRNDTCLIDIELHAQKMLTIIGSIGSMIGRISVINRVFPYPTSIGCGEENIQITRIYLNLEGNKTHRHQSRKIHQTYILGRCACVWMVVDIIEAKCNCGCWHYTCIIHFHFLCKEKGKEGQKQETDKAMDSLKNTN